MVSTPHGYRDDQKLGPVREERRAGSLLFQPHLLKYQSRPITAELSPSRGPFIQCADHDNVSTYTISVLELRMS